LTNKALSPPKTLKTFKIIKQRFTRTREGRFSPPLFLYKSRRGEKRYRWADGFAAPAGQRAVAHKALGQRCALSTTPQAPHSSKRVFDWILKGCFPNTT
jgi:hypothetical protein